MKSKDVQKKSDYHRYIERVITAEFDDIKFRNGRSIVVASIDEADKIFVYSRGSKEDVTLAICELFHAISKKDRVYVCEMFAEMLDCDNADYVFNSIKRRADFDTFHEDDFTNDAEDIPYNETDFDPSNDDFDDEYLTFNCSLN